MKDSFQKIIVLLYAIAIFSLMGIYKNKANAHFSNAANGSTNNVAAKIK